MMPELWAEPRLEQAVPVLPVANVVRSLAYFRDALGFDESWRWGDPPEIAGTLRDEVELNLAAAPDRAGTARVFIRVSGIEALYASFVQRGARVVTPIAEADYPVREFDVEDLDGNRITFGEATGDGE